MLKGAPSPWGQTGGSFGFSAGWGPRAQTRLRTGGAQVCLRFWGLLVNESGPVGADKLLTSALVYRLRGGGGGLPAWMVTAEVTPGECQASLLGPRCQGSEPVPSQRLHLCFQGLSWKAEGF